MILNLKTGKTTPSRRYSNLQYHPWTNILQTGLITVGLFSGGWRVGVGVGGKEASGTGNLSDRN